MLHTVLRHNQNYNLRKSGHFGLRLKVQSARFFEYEHRSQQYGGVRSVQIPFIFSLFFSVSCVCVV